jgi:uncharacterized protein (DUF488 family)
VQIGYAHLAELGGRRGRQRSAESSANAFWQNSGFRNFADYARTDGFRSGFAKLLELGHERRCAIMCAEAVWWRCHRRIIADYLISDGESVFHILGPAHVDPAQLTPSATPQPDGTIIYPAQDS